MIPRNPNFPTSPTVDEQIAVVQSMIDGVRFALTSLSGNVPGELTAPAAIHEIECLEAARKLLL